MAQEVIIEIAQPLIIEVHTADELLALPKSVLTVRGIKGDKGDLDPNSTIDGGIIF